MYFRIISLYTIIILIVFFVYVGLIRAQYTNIKFDKIGLEEGLSQSTVYSIIQDVQGFMWFGTQDGLNRYDGYTIKVFKHDPLDSNSISDNGIWCLLSDSYGDLWIGTERGGLNRYVYSENKFYHYTKNPDNNSSITDNYILSLFEDTEKNIWIGTQSAGICRFNRSTKSFTRLIFSSTDDTITSIVNSVRAIKQDTKGNLWVATGSGLFRIDASNLNSKKPHFKQYINSSANDASNSSNNINSLYLDNSGILWVGTWRGGIYGFNTETEEYLSTEKLSINSKVLSHSLINSIIECNFIHNQKAMLIGTFDGGLYHYNFINSAPLVELNDNVISIYEDRSGILWVGTFSNGVKIFNKRKNKFVQYSMNSVESNSIQSNAVIGMMLDKDGELWISSIGNVLRRYDKKRKKYMKYNLGSKSNDGSNNIFISSITQSTDGRIWIGTITGGIYNLNKYNGEIEQLTHLSKTKNSLLSNDVAVLFIDNESDILWIGYLNGGLSSYNLKSKLFNHFYPNEKGNQTIPDGLITSIYTGKRTGLWVGIADKGVVNYDDEKRSFKSFKLVDSEIAGNQSVGINNNYVFCFYEDNNGIVWMGTKGGGLNRYDPATKNFRNYTTTLGLPDNVIYGIVPDKSGNLWLSTNMGLSRFNPSTETFRNFDTKDGLQSNEFTEQAHFAAPDGELFFGGVKGFNSFYPEEIVDNDYIPPVYLTDFKIFDKSIQFSESLFDNKPLELSYSQNFFSFEFVALNFTLPEKNKYAYMLEGFDYDWHYVNAAQRQASYTNLDPGKYILRIKASNNDGMWNNDGTSMIIIVKPPFWMTLWFQIPLGIIILYILYLLYQYRVKKLLEVERIRSSIALDLHDEIGSTLTEIALYSDVSLKELHSEISRNNLNGSFTKVNNLLVSIGKTSRKLIEAMNDIVWAVDPKNDSMDSFLFRIKTQTSQMLVAKGIDFKIDIDDKVTGISLPLMHRRQIQLIFREALNNVIKHAGAKNVEVRIKKEDGSLWVNIVDDGIGINMNQLKKGNGLNNMTKRAALLNGKIEIKPNPERGTCIKLKVDLN